MRTKEPKPYRNDYEAISRASIKKDFRGASFCKKQSPERNESNVKRVLAIGEVSGYYQYRKFFIGKLVRVLRPAYASGVYVEFVRDSDRQMLNANAGWSEKSEYLLDSVKFDK